MKKKLAFIINPISGVGKQKVIEKAANLWLDSSVFDYTFLYTKTSKHAVELSKQTATEYDIVVAVADGTVNEVCRGLIAKKTILGIIPTGSGNGFARFLKIPLKVKEAILNINNLHITEVDTCTLNNEVFVNVAGAGFDAHISHLFNSYGKRGFSSYLKLVLREFLSYKSSEYILKIDGKEYIRKAFMISVANSSQFGFNAQISPLSKITDSKVEVCILKPFPKIVSPIIGARLFLNNIHKSKYMEVFEGKNIEISLGNQIIAHIDGDPLMAKSPIEIQLKPTSLKVITGIGFKD